MKQVFHGNAEDLPAQARGWLIGHFVDAPNCRTGDVEVKWGVHLAGDSNGSFAANKTARTLSVLLEGRFRLEFRSAQSDQSESTLLEKVGDFALWEPHVFHNWFAETNCKVLTIRWPSVPDDQIRLDER